MIDVRSVMKRGVLLAAVAILGASCGGCDDDVGEPVVVAPPPDYSNIGKAYGTPCVKTGNDNDVDKCKGQPPIDFVNGAPVGALSQFLQNPNRWTAESGPIEMEPENGTVKPVFTVAAVKDSRRFEFRQQDEFAYVVARITADPTGPKDRMYEIGDFPEPMENEFYVVVRGYDDSDQSEPPDADSVGPSRRISRWEIYGVKSQGRRLHLVSSGEVRWCGYQHVHPPNSPDATVRYCPPASKAAPASAQRVPVALQFASLMQRFRDPPLWFTCGLGCCIADEAF